MVRRVGRKPPRLPENERDNTYVFILFHPDCNRRPRHLTGSAVPAKYKQQAGARGLSPFFEPYGEYRRWGIAPRPENYCF